MQLKAGTTALRSHTSCELSLTWLALSVSMPTAFLEPQENKAISIPTSLSISYPTILCFCLPQICPSASILLPTRLYPIILSALSLVVKCDLASTPAPYPLRNPPRQASVHIFFLPYQTLYSSPSFTTHLFPGQAYPSPSTWYIRCPPSSAYRD